MTHIKLCGLSRHEDIEVVNQLKPDYIGFIFVEKSKRYVNPIFANELKKKLDKEIKVVGVFVDEELEIVNDLLTLGIIDIAQLHGSESNEYIENLKEISKKPVIKAFSIVTQDDLLEAKQSNADFILLDSKSGGSGTQFDWSLLKDFKKDYFLAGGLDHKNVYEAVKKINPFAVDVSSGIETNGLKDKDKMKEFVENVRKAIKEENG